MARTVIRGFAAHDAANGAVIALEPGYPVLSYRIQRNRLPDPEDGVYVMTFVCAGRRLRCPLTLFQARTESLPDELVEENPARETAIAR